MDAASITARLYQMLKKARSEAAYINADDPHSEVILNGLGAEWMAESEEALREYEQLEGME